MAVVTGTINRPGQAAVRPTVTVELIGRPAFVTATDVEIIGSHQASANSSGVWEIDLVPNSEITPANTYYRVTEQVPSVARRTQHDIIVPVGAGPFQLRDILTDPLVDLPAATPSNERDYDEITADNTALAINALAIASVANLVVAVPDSTRPCYIIANVGVAHTVADANVALAIGAVGLGTGDLALCKGAGWAQLGPATGTPPNTITGVGSVALRARIPAHSPGNYQLYANGTGGNVTLKGSAFAPSSLAVWEL